MFAYETLNLEHTPMMYILVLLILIALLALAGFNYMQSGK